MPAKGQPRFKSKRTLTRQPAPKGIYESTYDVELGAAICRRVAAGESLRSICRADAAMPTEKTVWNWARAHPAFRAMKDHAFATARARSLAARDAALAAKGPSPFACGFDWDIADAILERLAMGEALTAVCRDPRLPSVGTVYNWMKRYPAFLDQYRAVKVGLEETMVEIACLRLPQPDRERDFGPLIRRTMRQAERAARRVSLKRYAPTAAAGVVITATDPGGAERVLHAGGPSRTKRRR